MNTNLIISLVFSLILESQLQRADNLRFPKINFTLIFHHQLILFSLKNKVTP